MNIVLKVNKEVQDKMIEYYLFLFWGLLNNIYTWQNWQI